MKAPHWHENPTLLACRHNVTSTISCGPGRSWVGHKNFCSLRDIDPRSQFHTKIDQVVVNCQYWWQALNHTEPQPMISARQPYSLDYLLGFSPKHQKVYMLQSALLHSLHRGVAFSLCHVLLPLRDLSILLVFGTRKDKYFCIPSITM